MEQPPGWFAWLASIATLIGLGVALWQLARTRRAAAAAVAAVGRLRYYDASRTCVEAVHLLGEVRNYVDSEQWGLLPDRYRRIRQLLIEIYGLTPGLSDNERKDLHAVLTKVRIVEQRIQKQSWARLKTAERVALLASLEIEIDRLSGVAVQLRRIYGEPR